MSADRSTHSQPTRRHLMGLGAAIVMAISSRAARADSDADRATAFMTQMVTDLIAVVNGASGTSDRAVALQKIIDKGVDVNGIARFCLGRFWRQASADEQKQYIELFHKVLLKNITGKVGDYSGVDISIQKTFSRDDGIVVSSTVLRPNNAPAKVDWLVAIDNGKPLVIDVIAEGTSLRLTQRNDYSAFLTRNNNSVSALLDALKQQANG